VLSSHLDPEQIWQKLTILYSIDQEDLSPSDPAPPKVCSKVDMAPRDNVLC